MRQMRCRVGGIRVQAPEYGQDLVVGRVYDLDERLPCGGTLAEVTRSEWFETLTYDPIEMDTPRRRRTPGTDAMIPPASPAVEESDG